MALVQLYHPVTPEKAEEFVSQTAPSDISDEERKQRVETLLESAANNRAWRDSRTGEERIALQAEPFAAHDPDENTPPEERG